MFCQSCGAPNPGDARFCNMCGTRIAPPGAPGGMIADGTVLGVGAEAGPQASAAPAPITPAPPLSAHSGAENVWAVHERPATASSSYRAAPPPQPAGYVPHGGGPSMSSVSLHGIGVQSSGKTWATIAGVAVLLVALGAVGMWLMMRNGAPAEPAADATPTTPMEIGTPLPEGAEPPEVDFVSGGVRVTEGAGATAMGSTEQRIPDEAGERASTSPSAMLTSGGTARTGGAVTSPTTMTGGGASGGAGRSGGGAQAEAGSESGGGEPASGGGSARDESGATGGGTVPEGELPEERDIAIEMYAARVRFVIRRYYASRAQTCFDRATRNDPSLRGTVVVRFTIGNEGTVTDASTIRNSTGNSDLGACLANQVRSWRLPAPPGGELTLEMPFSN